MTHTEPPEPTVRQKRAVLTKRIREWKQWKKRMVADAPEDDREWLRDLLDDIRPPTPENDRRIDEIRKSVEAVFGKGKEPKRKKRRGKK